MSNIDNITQVPYGYCQCGCGQKVSIATKTSKRDGWIKGQPVRFLAGHQRKIKKGDFIAHFWNRVHTTDNIDDCWEWQGARHNFGYGMITKDRVSIFAHRLVWELTTGTIPDGLEVCHSCDNPPCCNPKHLFLGTHKQNMEDKANKKRSLIGEDHNMAKLTLIQVQEIRERYAMGNILQRELAKEYNITQQHISDIVCMRKWV